MPCEELCATYGGRCSVCGVAVSMAAFQAVDPGSTPGTRTLFLISDLFLSTL